MAKAKWNEEEIGQKSVKESRKTLPEVLELELEDRDRVVLLLEEAIELKKELDSKNPNSKAARLDDIKTELATIQMASGLDGLRHNRFVFVARYQDGRTSVDQKLLMQELLKRGVKAEVIKEAQEGATKQGNAFWVRELEILEG